MELPWDLPLDVAQRRRPFSRLDVGPSRHLVRFLAFGRHLFALKEEPIEIAPQEFEVLRQLEDEALPAVDAVGLAEAPERDSGILATEYLAHSPQYRRLLMRFPPGRAAYRDRLLDAMASLLVDLHRGGVFWGDGSLNNTLFRRDGDRIQAYLVDAETSELHPSLSDGQRVHDLDILLENVGFGLADLAAHPGPGRGARRRDRRGRASPALPGCGTSSTTTRTCAWRPAGRPARVRKLNELGFSVDEIELEPSDRRDRAPPVTVAGAPFPRPRARRLTGIVALENQARLLLNDLREYGAWLEWYERRPIDPAEVAERWRARSTSRRSRGSPGRRAGP